MCGIFSIIRNKPLTNKDIILGRKGSSLLRHRGPDSSGEWINKKSGVFIGHRRLSIIDLSSKGNQPMIRKNLVLAYNGEIYNFNEIKKSLVTKNFKFQSKSDTEVLINAWKAYGPDCLNYFDGMFGFIIWDGNNAWVSRDKFGEKQIFYYKIKDGIIISSELNVLTQLFSKKEKISKDSMTSFMSLGYIPSPKTIFENIFSLKPATVIKINKGKIVKEINYWKKPEFSMSREKKDKFTKKDLDNLHQLIIESVESRIVSDAKKCLFLSSGIDSSLLASIISKDLKKNISCLTVNFKNLNIHDESRDAKKISNFLKLPHKIINPIKQPENISINTILDFYGEPNDNISISPIKQMSQAASNLKFKVGITGMGGDELFFGYHKQAFAYKYIHLYNMNEKFRIFLSKALNPFSKIFPKIKIYENILGVPDRHLYLALKNMPIINELNELPNFDLWTKKFFNNFEGKNFFSKIANFELNTGMPDSRLNCYDYGGMSVSHELRSPYLNPKILSFITQFRSDIILNSGKKQFLKEILLRYLPKNLVHSFKKGFVYSYLDFLNKNRVYSYPKGIIKELSGKKIGNYPNENKYLTRYLLFKKFSTIHDL